MFQLTNFRSLRNIPKSLRENTNIRFTSTSAKGNSLQNIETKRIFLEELLQEPVLTQSAENNMNFQQRTDMKNYKLPTSVHDIENAFQSEFNQSIKATDWTEYEPLDSSINVAGQLAREYLLNAKIKTGKVLEDDELEKECAVLYNESQTGDYSRFASCVDSNELDKIESSLQPVYLMAKNALDSNPYLHPSVKHQFLKIIASYLYK